MTFSSGISNQHTTSISGEGNPTLSAIRKIAEDLRINKWKETVREVYDAVSIWEKLAVELQIPKTISNRYRRAIEASPCYVELAGRSKIAKIAMPQKMLSK